MLDADCLVLPSLFEGSSLVLLEALACGLGVVQSANAGMGATGTTGRVLDDLSEEALYNTLMEIIEQPDLLAGWRANAPARAGEFTFERYCSSVGGLMAELAGNELQRRASALR